MVFNENLSNIGIFSEDPIVKWEDELPISKKRGVHGVFDVDELVHLLRFYKAYDIVAIKIPKEYRYCDYFGKNEFTLFITLKIVVIGSVLSVRHMKALMGYIKKAYKIKKSKRDPFLGPDKVKHMRDISNDQWEAIDMGKWQDFCLNFAKFLSDNIVVHLMSYTVRREYDIEQLWTVGAEYDEKTNSKTEEKWENLMKEYTIRIQQ